MRFDGGWGDWFIIGGRWSGELLRGCGLTTNDAKRKVGPLGAPHDAMLLTLELYQSCVVQHAGMCEVRPDWEGVPGFVDLNYDVVGPDFIGRKWIVVVDLHD